MFPEAVVDRHDGLGRSRGGAQWRGEVAPADPSAGANPPSGQLQLAPEEFVAPVQPLHDGGVQLLGQPKLVVQSRVRT
jgi:hypothetical protein